MNEPNQTTIDVPEGIRIARAAFLRDFASLLADRKTKGKFVCYRKDKLVAVATNYRSILREVVAKGFPEDEWLILKVLPGEEREQKEILDEAELNPG